MDRRFYQSFCSGHTDIPHSNYSFCEYRSQMKHKALWPLYLHLPIGSCHAYWATVPILLHRHRCPNTKHLPRRGGTDVQRPSLGQRKRPRLCASRKDFFKNRSKWPINESSYLFSFLSKRKLFSCLFWRSIIVCVGPFLGMANALYIQYSFWYRCQ